MEGYRRDAVHGRIRSKLLMTRNNLMTDGSEFVLPDGRPYSGLYHVHIKEGAMEGARHTKAPHRPLTPVNEVVDRKVAIIQKGMRNESSVPKTTTSTPRTQMRQQRTTVPPRRPSASPSPQRYGSGSGY